MAAGFLSFALVASVVTMALRSPGFEETEVDLHESGVWVTGDGLGVARFNLEIDEFEVSKTLNPDEDIHQDFRDLVVAGGGRMARIDPIALTRADSGKDPIVIPESARVDVRAGTAIVFDAVSGALWSMDATTIGTQSITDDVEPLVPPATEEGTSVAVVDGSGRIHHYRAGSSSVQTFPAGARAGGAPPVEVPVAEAVDRPQMAAVGDRVVLLDRENGQLVVADGPVIDLAPHGADDLQLQQTGPASPFVLVAGGGKLLEVPLAGGAPRVRAEGGGGGAIRPVRARGCAWAAFQVKARWARPCESGNENEAELESLERATPIPELEGGAGRLEFRVNRGRVVLNEVESGTVVTVDKPKVETFTWDIPEPDNITSTTSTTNKESNDRCGEDGPRPAELEADEVGTRPGRPVVVRVLENDKIDQCDVARIRLDSDVGDRARVEVVQNETALQVTPTGSDAPVRVDYTVVTLVGEYPASLVVEVATDGNRPPAPVEDRTYTTAGRTLEYDVLRNDTDPDGDVLTLVAVEPVGSAPEVVFRADGVVTHRAPAGAGPYQYTYTVRDEAGAREKSTLDIQVAAEASPPEVRGDFLRVRVGGRGSINLLDNDTDADTDHVKLQVVEMDTHPDLVYELDEKTGLVTVNSVTRPDRITLDYQVTDQENEPVEGTLVVQVDPASTGNADPVAVRDVARLRPDLPTLVAVLGNDFDPDGDLLAVTAAEPSGAGVIAEVLEMRILRVTAVDRLEAPVTVDYTVSDGRREATGTVIVVPYEDIGHNQKPTANTDHVEVKAGQWTSVKVLANDMDPEGERLVVRPDSAAVDAEFGDAFVQGDLVRFRPAPGVEGMVEVTYEAEDPAREWDTGTIEVQVLPPDWENRPPEPLRLEARVFAGSEVVIPVPLVGADRDGDVVAIKGVLPENPPDMGDVSLDPKGGGLVYRADRGASGPDEFGFILTDGRDPEQRGSTVRVVVVEQPRSQFPPVAVPDEVTMQAGSSRFIDVRANDTDPEDDELTVVEDGATVVSESDGEVEVRNEQLWYTAPDLPADEDDRWVNLTYLITDGVNEPAEGLVRVRVLPADTEEIVRPVALDDMAPLTEFGATVELDVLENDYDLDALDRSELQLERVVPEPGTADDWSMQWTPDGRVTITVGETPLLLSYTMNDGDPLHTARALISVPVVASLPPTAVLDEEGLTVPLGGEIRIPVLANDLNGSRPQSELSLVGVTRGRRGEPTKDGNEVVYRPGDTGGPGDGGFSYLIRNEQGQQAVGRVRVEITAPDDSEENPPPVFLRSGRRVLDAGGDPVELDLRDFARDDDPLTFTATSGDPAALGVDLDGSSLRLTARPEAPDALVTVALTAYDGYNDRAEGAIEVEIRAVDEEPDLPVARPDSGTLRAGESACFPVLGNDTPEGELSFVGQPDSTGGGDAIYDHAAGCIRYQSVAGDFAAPVRIRYTVTDKWAPEGRSPSPDRQVSDVLTITVWGRPGPPAFVIGEPRNGAVLVSWQDAPGNGLSVDGYVVEVSSPGGGRVPAEYVEVRSTEADITGLQNGRSYRFRVAAFNREFPDRGSLVEESWSAPSPEYRPDAEPPAPVGLQLQWRKDANNGGAGGILHLSWQKPPDYEGSEIVRYLIYSSQGGDPIRVDAPLTTSEIPGLTNGSPYTFEVSAENEAGEGPHSAPSNTETPTGVPDAPTGVTVERRPPNTVDDAFVLVSFQAGDDGGEAPTFAITSVPASSGNPYAGTPGNANAVGPLTAGTQYRFTVVATNRAGPSPAGESPEITAYSKPLPVGAPTVTSGADTLTVTWPDTPNAGGGQPTYTLVPSGGRGEISPASSGYRDSVGEGGCFSYQVRVSNDGGYESDLSPPSATVCAFGRPDVTVSTANAGREITWTWPRQEGVERYTPDCVGNPCRVTRTVSWGAGTQCLTVTAEGFGNTQTRDGVCVEVPDPRFWYYESTSSGFDSGKQGCGEDRVPRCRYVGLRWSGLTGLPPGPYTISCWGAWSQSLGSLPESGDFGPTQCLSGNYSASWMDGLTVTGPDGSVFNVGSS